MNHFVQHRKVTIEQSDSLKAEREMYAALLARREALEEALRKKTEELKALCLQEGELTGELPPELPLARGEQPPVFRRRVGTTFSLSVKKVQDSDQLSNELSQLELEVELQGKITSAAQRLASDKTVSKVVRKQRRQSYTKAVGKLKDMEKKLGEMRKEVGKATAPPVETSSSLAAASEEPLSTSRNIEGMYHVVDPRSVNEVDNANVHDLSSAGGQPITAHQLHGKLPHRFQNRRQRGSGEDLDSVHSGDSGVTGSGGGVTGLSRTSSGYSSLSPSPSPSLGGAAASAVSSTSLCDSTAVHTLPVHSNSRRLASDSNCHDDQHLFPDDSSSLDSTTDACLSPRIQKSFQDDSSSGCCSLDMRDSPERVLPTNLPKTSTSVSLDERSSDRSESASRGRRKHFVVSRGPQRSRLMEVKVRGREESYTEVANTSLIKMDFIEDSTEDQTVARLAKAEPDELDSSCGGAVWDDEEDIEDESSRGCSSFGGDTSFGGDSEEMEEYKLWKEEQKFSTRVLRRKQTVILSRSLKRKNVNVIENGYKAFENICMGSVGPRVSVSSISTRSRGKSQGDSVHNTSVSSIVSEASPRGRTMARNPYVKYPSTSQVLSKGRRVAGPDIKEAELQEKIQHVISNTQDMTKQSNTRSRSVESSRNNRLAVPSPSYGGKLNITIDDIRVENLPTRRKDSTSSVASKSGTLFSKMREHPRQVKPSSSGSESVFSENLPSPSGCLGGGNGRKYETNFGVIAGNIKSASINTNSARCVSRQNTDTHTSTHTETNDFTGQEGERCSVGNVTSSTIRDSSGSSISTASEGCTTPTSSGSMGGSGGDDDDDGATYRYPNSSTAAWQPGSKQLNTNASTIASHRIETAV
ncbi:Ferm domain-containing protein 4a [Plakobranchus ocellatus]|uniref:Ferm domain-containing protein 4a n=1 Tax=Plakobranchus ocellatus TaxID=259542 RepID=A0AAV4DLC3_9GAST|nr:Ferm domain-containing protein 4a [Plakobranchus ocellatus]